MRRQRYHSVLKASPAAAAALLWWRLKPFRVAVAGRSMEPTLRAGDFLIALGGLRPRIGSMVVVEHPERSDLELVKRVTGAQRLAPDRALYWVAGDDAAASTDSRTFGPVESARVKGVIVARYWPRDRLRRFRSSD